MTLLGTQAEMTFEGYFPVMGHNSYGNVISSGSVLPLNNVDNIFKDGNYYNAALLLPSLDQRLVQYKEVVKQTMLKHEAIFKDQIHELHHIYWRQRELMDEMKKDELLNHSRQQRTLLSNPFSPHDLCDYPPKTSHVLSFPEEIPVCNRSSVSAAEIVMSLSHFNDRKFTHSVPDPAQIDLSLKGCEFQSHKKFGKKILDLELPPTEYMDSEDEESLQKVPVHPLNRISEAVHNIDWQPYRSSGVFNSVFKEDNLTPGLASFKKNLLADLNEPIKLEEKSGTTSIYMPDLNEHNKDEEEVAAASKFLVDLNEPIELQEEEALCFDFQSPLPGHAEFSSQDLSQKSNPGIQLSLTDMILNTETGRDGETCSNDLDPEKYVDDAGLSEGVSASLQYIVPKQAPEHETSHLMDQKKRKSFDEDLESPGNDLSSNSNPTSVSTDNIGNSFQFISLTDEGNSKPSSVSSSNRHSRDIVRTPIIVQALPCFSSSLQSKKGSKSSITGSCVSGKMSGHGKNLKLSSKFVNASFHQSSFCNGSSAKSRKLESSPPSIGSNGQDASEEKDLVLKPHVLTKLENSVRKFPWLETKSVGKKKRGKRSESSTQVKACQKPSKDEGIKNGANDRAINNNLDSDPLPESEEQVTSHKLVAGGGIGRKVSCFGAGIGVDLCMEDDESSPKPSPSTELGLEAPVSPENKESTPPRRDSDKNQVETPSELSGKEDGDVQEDLPRDAVEAIASGEEDKDLQGELLGNAAMALVSISSSVVQICPEMAACDSSEPSRSDDELHWFAKVVSIVADDPDSEFRIVLTSKDNDGYEECMFNGLDYFEAMTLNLTETKVDEADWFKTSDQKGKKEEESGIAFLPRQQSRGPMRRARQLQKDFRSEILPSLATLSWCEVTEDFQTIEGMIKAANNLNRGTVRTRSMSRNARERGRKGLRVSTSNNPTDIIIQSPSKHRIILSEERRLASWGNVTRRCRGPRIHATTNPWLR